MSRPCTQLRIGPLATVASSPKAHTRLTSERTGRTAEKIENRILGDVFAGEVLVCAKLLRLVA